MDVRCNRCGGATDTGFRCLAQCASKSSANDLLLRQMPVIASGGQTHTAKESLLDRIKQLELEATARGLGNFAYVLRDARIRICELEAQTAYQEGR